MFYFVQSSGLNSNSNRDRRVKKKEKKNLQDKEEEAARLAHPGAEGVVLFHDQLG